jgi:methionyl-tRNA formyltransferase
MKILFLGYDETRTKLISFLRREGHSVTHYDEKLSVARARSYDLIISYGYRFILKNELLATLPREAINLHISLLPYNRGAHPNFWAFYDHTPHGVTIHHIDQGLDTGDVLFQKRLFFTSLDYTFRQTYNILTSEIENLFIQHWDAIREYQYIPHKQTGLGQCHKVSDLPQFSLGWDAPIREVIEELAVKNSGHSSCNTSMTVGA